ncbi:putative tRNAHis guanylyltransferase [Gregarina niphandrodes]|uniref:tRNA(His) guanylyltransferase n=1 Tax=Gregarina niphandrodes TaxID=110365 RepID=A0A023B4J1_GRENI|nr:putative tRNAHis guanylyltransferase [Gregarina niphandrodes]EZG56481.1 putative tRNAHis guanylyltransferase [Gregarina niphandrodes]|eukprot:XP_011131256.1 putative tRNAHis guanylyltransferase [Gregarina niphandrodes]
MACSKYEYVKSFELDDTLLPETYIVLRIDGRGFTKFTEELNFRKPNDNRGLWVMTRAAVDLMVELGGEIILSYGQSDEYSFVFRKRTSLYNRRRSKILSTVVSIYTGAYLRHLSIVFPHYDWRSIRKQGNKTKQVKGPIFDGRIILYPNLQVLQDYLAWRQVDCHINNLHNYCFWNMVYKAKAELTAKAKVNADKADLSAGDATVITSDSVQGPHSAQGPHSVQGPHSAQGPHSVTGNEVTVGRLSEVKDAVHHVLKLTNSSGKNEILFSQFGINYNTLPELHRKGTLIYRTGPSQSLTSSLVHHYPHATDTLADDPYDTTEEGLIANDQVLPFHRFCSDSPFRTTAASLVVSHQDCIKKDFWQQRDFLVHLLED